MGRSNKGQKIVRQQLAAASAKKLLQTLILVSLSDKQENITVDIKAALITKNSKLIDPILRETVEAATEAQNPQLVKLTLKPFQDLVGRL